MTPPAPNAAPPPRTRPQRATITGLVLAGGRGTRMGGADKGLLDWQGRPLVDHVLDRLRPQVAGILINANRHATVYARRGWPVCPDALPDRPGPLAGLLAGLQCCPTDWLVTVPCDSPLLPADLADRLAAGALAEGCPIAMAATRDGEGWRAQPVFALVHRECAESLAQALDAGERKVDRWMRAQGVATVVWDEAGAFANVNTPDDLASLQPAS